MNIQEKLFRILLSAICIALFAACADSEESQDTFSDTAEIAFGGAIQTIVTTRAADSDEPATDLISSENDYGDIHIHTYVEDDATTVPGDFRTDGVYVTDTRGTAGRLEPKDDNQKLEWHTTTNSHYFQAWNAPDGVTMDDGGGSIMTGKVDFAPKNEKTEELDSNTGVNKKNNIALEKFIGAREGAVSYRTNGSYVELVFRHLVGKITVVGVQRTKTDNTKTYLSDVKITFPDMPRYADFSTGIVDNGSITAAPTVTADIDGEKELSFNATSRIYPVNDSRDDYYPFYLPPFEFGDYGEFIVEGYEWHVNEKDEDGNVMESWPEKCGPYYGHLKDLPLTELKAGEHIALSLQVRDGQVFGMSTMILGWSELPDRTSGHSPKHKGIYNEDDMRRMYDYIKALVEEKQPDDSLIENLYTVETDENGNEVKVFRLYNDIDLKSYNVWIGWLGDMPDGYIFNGMGHNIISYVQGNGTITNLFDKGASNVEDLYIDGEKI